MNDAKDRNGQPTVDVTAGDAVVDPEPLPPAERAAFLERCLELEHAVSRVLSEETSLERALPRVLDEFVRRFELRLAEAWTPHGESLELEMRRFGDAHDPPSNRRATPTDLRVEFGTGLTGSIWKERVPARLLDLQRDPRLARLRAAESSGAGGTAFGLPVVVDDGCIAVFTFLSPTRVPADDGFLQTLVSVERSLEQFTRRTRAEQSLREAQRSAESASRVRADFLAKLSHELRTPTSSIVGLAEILLGRLEKPLDVDDVRAIQRNGARLVELLDELLDLTRVESGGLRVDLGPTPLAELVREVEADVRPRSQQAGVALTTQFVRDVPATVRTDRALVRQILGHLAANAIDASGAGSVSLSVEFTASPRPTTVFRVVDTGTGLPSDELEHVFEPFWRSSRVTARRRESGGLGLAIARRLARQLGGDVFVASTLGQGTTFTLRLPTGPVEGVAIGKIAQAAISSDGVEPPRAKARLEGRVLVADDHADSRRIATHLLEQAGARVVTTADGAELVASVAQAERNGDPFCAVLVDMQMPTMSGEEAVARLRADGFRRPIVALTAAASVDERERWRRSGCDDVFAKPVSEETLIARLAELCRRAPQTAPPDAHSVVDDRPFRVLLVEDDRDAAEAMRRLLSRYGAHVEVAHTAAEALARGLEFRPELLLADLQLPDLHGSLLIGLLRKQLADALPYCVAVSGLPPDFANAREGGFDLHLRKPVDPARLRELCRNARHRPSRDGSPASHATK